METDRFAPPRAQVNDISFASDGYQPVRLWPASGRIGRLRMLAYSLGLYVLFIVFSALVGAGLGFAGKSGGSGFGTGMGLFSLVGFVIYIFASAIILIQRSHDMNMSGWWSIAAFIPLVGLFWLFNPGTRGSNRWGAPPPPNGLAVKILAWFFPALFVIGIVAAIALPAYQQYNVRARAAAPAPTP